MATMVHELVVSMVDDLFGSICSKTINTILKHSRINMKDLIQQTGFDRRTVNQALCVLIKHRYVKFEDRRPVVYLADITHALNLPLYPQFVHIIKTQHGDLAEIVVEEILHQGCTSRSKVLETCLVRLRATDTTTPDKTSSTDTATQENLDNIFEVLVSRCYIEKVEEEAPTEPPSKKMRIGEGSVLWRINTITFLNFIRDLEIVNFVKNRFDDGAGEVVNVILNLNNKVDSDMSLVTSSVSYDQILQGLKSKAPNLVVFARSYLDILTDSSLGIIKMIEEYNGGSYIIHFGSFYQEFAQHHICSIVKERFGPKCHRVFAIVLAKKMVEQKQVSELAMVPFKDAKELLYKLYTEQFVHLQELHRTPDFCPTRTFYMFNVPVEKLRLKLLNTCYKAIFNLMSIRKEKLNENSRLVEKSLRADAAMVQAQQRGIPPEDLEDLLTSSEKQQLGVCMRVVKRLDLGEINIVESICALTHFGTNSIS